MLSDARVNPLEARREGPGCPHQTHIPGVQSGRQTQGREGPADLYADLIETRLPQQYLPFPRSKIILKIVPEVMAGKLGNGLEPTAQKMPCHGGRQVHQVGDRTSVEAAG